MRSIEEFERDFQDFDNAITCENNETTVCDVCGRDDLIVGAEDKEDGPYEIENCDLTYCVKCYLTETARAELQ